MTDRITHADTHRHRVDELIERYSQQLDTENALLLSLLRGTAHETGDAFFRVLVRELAAALGTFGALIADYLPDKQQLRPRAYWLGDDWVNPGSYDIAGTPCEGVILGGELFQIPDRVVAHYPQNTFLQDNALMSYTGMAFKNDAGEVIGHLAVLDRKPLPNEDRFMALFEIFGARAAAELRRIQAEEVLRAQKARLSRVVDGAMDGIVDFNDALSVAFMNRAAEHTFQTNGQPTHNTSLHAWLTEASMDLVQSRLADFKRHPDRPRRSWLPHGLEGKRPNGERFPIEASLAEGRDDDGTPSYTLIFRDVQALSEAERRIERLELETQSLRDQLGSLDRSGTIIGRSPALQTALGQVRQVAGTDATVLFVGETGCGKELFARELHERSERRDRPLIIANCAAIPRDLVESEFFGHVKGAFTGATSRRDGRFVAADGGTLFLDEIGELPVDLQAKLLRVLQEGEVQPVGASNTRKVDVRVIAATNRDLEAAMREGAFREDLYYRLSAFPVRIPPLRERGDDVLYLAEHFAEHSARRLGRRVKPIHPAAAGRLRAWHWSGNVRELQNIIEHAVITTTGDYLHPDVTPQAMTSDAVLEQEDRILNVEELRALQKANIERALIASDGRIAGADGAARLLGVSESTLRSQMKSLGVNRN